MSRRELADAANAWLWNTRKQRENLTEHDIGRYERGEVHWPRRWRRLAIRAVLNATTDTDVGFYPNRRTGTAWRNGVTTGVEHASTAGLPTPHSPRVGDFEGVVAASCETWQEVRGYLNRHRSDLGRRAVELYPDEVRVGRTPLISPPGWRPDRPVDLDHVQLVWRSRESPARVYGDEPEARLLLPLYAHGKQYDRYTAAMRYVDAPSLFENRPAYRLLDLSWGEGSGRMAFGLGTYFDKLDICEAVGHEYAKATAGGAEVPTLARLPFRALLGDPFDLTCRIVPPAATTLMIRLDGGKPSFLLHWRDPAKVATAGGMYDVIPAGEFQPSSVGQWDQLEDFDLWRNIVRELSEELLGAPEHDGSRATRVDYRGWPLYQALQQARQHQLLRVACLGVGLDALTLAATIMTVLVIDGPTFDTILGDIVEVNAEGRLVAGHGTPARAAEGIPFTEDVVTSMLTNAPLASPGAACLYLAWTHRHQLLGPDPAGAAGTVGLVTTPPTDATKSWFATRRYQRQHRGDLAREAADLYPEVARVNDTLLLTRPDWVPNMPLPLQTVIAELEAGVAGHTADGLLEAAARLLPSTGPGAGRGTYAEAVRDIEQPLLLVDRPTYRLTDADLAASPARMSFALGTYFDVLNIGEAAAHEYTHARRTGKAPTLGQLPLRSTIGDPTDPSRRPLLCAITTLTIRHDRRTGQARFLVHWRDPAKVATNGGAHQLAPVGMFQPASTTPDRATLDLDPWRCMAREYSEELLGTPEIDNPTYQQWPFWTALEQARQTNTCRPYLLGIGVDSLTLATDLLTVVVFDHTAFDDLFKGLVATNAEGHFITEGEHQLLGTPFTHAEVHRLTTSTQTQPAGTATLSLAWQHRHILLDAPG